MNERKIAALCMLPFFIIFILFQILPFAWIIINSFYVEDFGYGFDNFTRIMKSKFYKNAFIASFKISFISSFIALIIALIGSYSLFKLENSKLSWLFIPFNTMISNFSGVPLTFAFIILIGSNGTLNILLRQIGIGAQINLYSDFGVNLVYVYFQIPLAILLLFPAFKILDKSVEYANSTLGASKICYWFKIAIPMLMPAAMGVFIILFANAIGAYATIYALTSGNFNVIPIRIASLISGDLNLNPYLASALSIFLVILMAIVAALSSFIAKKYDFKAKK